MTPQQQNFTDTHCHLNISAFGGDLPDVLARARLEGIQRMLIPGMDLETSRFAIEISQDIPEAYAAVGVHPHYADSWNDEVHAEIRELARSSKVVAIGEIGLDFYRNLSSREAQISAFKDQLQLASELELPVVIHNREAMAEILEIIVPWAEHNASSAFNLLVFFMRTPRTLNRQVSPSRTDFILGLQVQSRSEMLKSGAKSQLKSHSIGSCLRQTLPICLLTHFGGSAMSLRILDISHKNYRNSSN
jgi:predicted urease superfamily metal-dependent hydrolase